jgi:PAS domain S-box-containing protein
MHSMGPETMAGLDPRVAQLANTPARMPGLFVPMLRAFFWVGAGACLVGALLVGQFLWAQHQGAGLAVLFLVLALVFAGGARLPAEHLAQALTLALTVTTLAIATTTWAQGWGLSSPGMSVVGLMACLLCVAAGWQAATFLVVVATLALVAVGWFTQTPRTPGLAAALLQLGMHLICLGVGLGTGITISKVMARYMRAAQEREARFRSLLGLAADAYWEIDTDYRLLASTDTDASLGAGVRPLAQVEGVGKVPWELPQFACDAEALDGLRADLEQRQPFRDVPMRWTTAGRDSAEPSTTREYLMSGEPRFNSRGQFTGYWGVARDVTAAKAAQAALAATETRYRELFSRIPTPLVLHRSGTVLEANPSAVALFGAPGAAAMVGRDLLGFYTSGDSRERARRRMETLHGQPLGTALPVTDFKLQLPDREVAVRATSVSVDAEGGPANLAIYVDDTERLAAEEAVRRSEAMLSHLVATSPDLITLTDVASGRYVMVNRAFERISGWRSEEAVGHTAAELGVWGSDTARDEFVQKLRETGEVNDLPVVFVGKNGTRVSLIVSAARFVMERRDYMVVNARDVSERERERMEREAILAHASIGIAVTRAGRFVLVNRHFETMYGWGAGEMLGQLGSVVWANAADHAALGAEIGPPLGRGEAVEIERLSRRKDGSSFVARVRGRAIDLNQPSVGGTVWIIEDITERRQAEQALARARDEAEAANRAKSAFLANTSHELRTPLNGMIGLAGLARDEGLNPVLRRQYLDQIAQSAQSLARIISDILDLSKIEAGKLQVDHAPFCLADELRTLHGTYNTLAMARQLDFRLHIAPEVEGQVMGDALRVRQVLSNFLTNAIKFTERGGLSLRARRLGASQHNVVHIEVQDSGPGLDEATRQQLFKPFVQADQSTTRRFGGTGLGLSICRELAGLMGGTVGVHSRVGEGSVFWAEISLPPYEGATAQPTWGAPGWVEAGRAPPPRVDHSRALLGRRVLMVEDNAVNMMIAVAMLESWGVAVTQAQHGREAVSLVQQEAAAGRHFDAVLMDVHMPVMSGYEATQALRALQQSNTPGGGRHLPIIALTAAALVTERDAAHAAGMDDFLTKPIDADKLRTTLLRFCPTDLSAPTAPTAPMAHSAHSAPSDRSAQPATTGPSSWASPSNG